MKHIIKLRNIIKKYNDSIVIDNLNLDVPEGSIFAFLGVNGAGKSTTIRILLDLTKVDNGDIEILGESLKENREKILSNIGSLVEGPSFYPNLSAYDNLKIFSNIKGTNLEEIPEILKKVNLYEAKDKATKNYSLGMKQRLGIAIALLGNPKLLILDEPTNGLDPKGIHEIRELIINLAKEGKTIFISSHILGEIELIATDYAIIHKGKLIFNGDVNKLRNLSETKLIIKTNDNNKALEVLKDNDIQASEVKDFIIVKDNKINNNYIAYTNKILVNNDIDVYHLNLVKKSLEEIFLEMTGEGE
ncbi:MAG: ATP-binding cassette domain-containing protein [Clostridium sp.]|uniref:ABC transporter ATP-binding protein n=1 Tax=Clostridium sp. TaxID=1506 RepID=UPI002A752043|nr:ATP-binding cassette domain-containing protein [Clostridium sp.]MDY2630769.1 ATP-binding cassette domain-containing protein [Clostridium sp.]